MSTTDQQQVVVSLADSLEEESLEVFQTEVSLVAEEAVDHLEDLMDRVEEDISVVAVLVAVSDISLVFEKR